MPVLSLSEIVGSLQARQYAMQQEQNDLLQKNQECLEEAKDISGAKLKSNYSEMVLQDKSYIQQFNKAIEAHNVVEEEYPITTNKTKLILDWLDGHPLNEDGEFTVRYDNTISTLLPILGNTEFWGSSLSTFHTATLLYRLRAITGNSFTQIMPMDSSIFHIAPLTKGLLSCLDNSLLQNKNYIFQNGSDLGFGFIHSGFAFGGSRNQEWFYSKYLTYPKDDIESAKYFPHDCSSWIASIFKQKYSSSTDDLLCTYRILSKSTDFVPVGWDEQELAKELLDRFIPVDPFKERLQSQDIYVYRTFSPKYPEQTSLGATGHVGLIFSSPTNNKLESIEFSRSMPEVEGFGIKITDLKNPSTIKPSDDFSVDQLSKKLCYLRLKV